MAVSSPGVVSTYPSARVAGGRLLPLSSISLVLSVSVLSISVFSVSVLSISVLCISVLSIFVSSISLVLSISLVVSILACCLQQRARAPSKRAVRGAIGTCMVSDREC